MPHVRRLLPHLRSPVPGFHPASSPPSPPPPPLRGSSSHGQLFGSTATPTTSSQPSLSLECGEGPDNSTSPMSRHFQALYKGQAPVPPRHGAIEYAIAGNAVVIVPTSAERCHFSPPICFCIALVIRHSGHAGWIGHLAVHRVLRPPFPQSDAGAIQSRSAPLTSLMCPCCSPECFSTIEIELLRPRSGRRVRLRCSAVV